MLQSVIERDSQFNAEANLISQTIKNKRESPLDTKFLILALIETVYRMLMGFAITCSFNTLNQIN